MYIYYILPHFISTKGSQEELHILWNYFLGVWVIEYDVLFFPLTLELLDLGGGVVVLCVVPLTPSPFPWPRLRCTRRSRNCGTVITLLSPWRMSSSSTTWAGDCVLLSPCPVARPKRQMTVTSWISLNVLMAQPWEDLRNMFLHWREDAEL